jgi:calcium-dependent protein kinase
MGCISNTSTVKNTDPGKILKSKQIQGAKELKKNYVFATKTKVLGAGAFGKVFLTHNKNNKDFQVAIKILNM